MFYMKKSEIWKNKRNKRVNNICSFTLMLLWQEERIVECSSMEFLQEERMVECSSMELEQWESLSACSLVAQCIHRFQQIHVVSVKEYFQARTNHSVEVASCLKGPDHQFFSKFSRRLAPTIRLSFLSKICILVRKKTKHDNFLKL